MFGGISGNQPSYDKLIAKLQQDHMGLSNADALSYIMELKEANHVRFGGLCLVVD